MNMREDTYIDEQSAYEFISWYFKKDETELTKKNSINIYGFMIIKIRSMSYERNIQDNMLFQLSYLINGRII